MFSDARFCLSLRYLPSLASFCANATNISINSDFSSCLRYSRRMGEEDSSASKVPEVSYPVYPLLAFAISGSSSAITETSSPCSMRSRYSSTAATPCLQSCSTGQVQIELSFPFSRDTSVKYSSVPSTRATRLSSEVRLISFTLSSSWYLIPFAVAFSPAQSCRSLHFSSLN